MGNVRNPTRARPVVEPCRGAVVYQNITLCVLPYQATSVVGRRACTAEQFDVFGIAQTSELVRRSMTVPASRTAVREETFPSARPAQPRVPLASGVNQWIPMEANTSNQNSSPSPNGKRLVDPAVLPVLLIVIGLVVFLIYRGYQLFISW